MNRKLAQTAAILCFALFSVSASAANIDYDFTVTIDTAGSTLNGQSFNGSFSYDDAGVSTPGLNGEDLFALSSFSFVFAGSTYALGDLDYGFSALATGAFLGLDAGGTDFSFLPATSDFFFPASFAYDFGDNDSGFGSIAFNRTNTPGNTVPEPGSLVLCLLGLGLLANRRFGNCGRSLLPTATQITRT